MKDTIRSKVHNALDIKFSQGKGLSFVVNISLSVLIFINSIVIIVSTIPTISSSYHQLLINFEVFSVIVFTAEYLLRIWSCVEKKGYSHPVKGRLKFMFSFWGLVDFLAIFPFFFTMFTADFGLIRILRLLRILRLFRMSRYFHAFKVINSVLRNKKEELILSFSFIFFLMIISSSLMYYIEHDSQPEVFSSIPTALWWGVNTMTTVGYGDIFPITKTGKVLGAFVAICGISLFAMPAGILASGFNEHIRGYKNEQGKVKCPFCHTEYYLADRKLHQH